MTLSLIMIVISLTVITVMWYLERKDRIRTEITNVNLLKHVEQLEDRWAKTSEIKLKNWEKDNDK